jgi:hypothetical protein
MSISVGARQPPEMRPVRAQQRANRRNHDKVAMITVGQKCCDQTGAEGIRKLSLTCICNRCHTSKTGQSSYAALAAGGIIAPFSLAIFAHAATCEGTGREIGTKKSSARYAPRRSLRRAPMQSFARQLAGKRRTAPSNLTRKRSFARYARSCSLRSAPMQSFVRMLAGKRRTAPSNFARIGRNSWDLASATPPSRQARREGKPNITAKASRGVVGRGARAIGDRSL